MSDLWQPEENSRIRNLRCNIGKELCVCVWYPGHIGVAWALNGGHRGGTLASGVLHVASLDAARKPALQAAADWLRENLDRTQLLLEEMDGPIGNSRGVPQPNSETP